MSLVRVYVFKTWKKSGRRLIIMSQLYEYAVKKDKLDLAVIGKIYTLQEGIVSLCSEYCSLTGIYIVLLNESYVSPGIEEGGD